MNQDNTLNSSKNPAPIGSIVQIFGTGSGLWNSSVADGLQLPYTPPFPLVAAPVTVGIGGVPAAATYSGMAPGLVAGMLQVNATIPNGLSDGAQSVIISVGQHDNTSQKVTVSVR